MSSNPFAAFCEDFYVNMRLGSQLALPHSRETLLHFFERIQKAFNIAHAARNVAVSLADLIVLGGDAAIERAAKNAGHDVQIPFTAGRTDALRSVVDSDSVGQAEFSPTFVLMQYFGYLRRDPDSSGFNFWLAKLNSFGGDFRRAEMVKAFISSTEYRQRFGQP